MNQHRSINMPFKPRARMLLLLGDQLIRDPGIAIFELVKNAYDADSPDATVTMSEITDQNRGKIIVEDSGTGMDYETITKVWLEPGTDYRAQQRKLGQRTHKYNRLPLGEKGVGRFAAHKLGQIIKLVTRMSGKLEVVVEINWSDFEKEQYLADAKVSVEERTPVLFTDNRTGTYIEIRKLRDIWTRAMVRDLHRAVMSICSPFGGPDDFKPKLRIEPDNGWLSGLLQISHVLELALFYASCTLKGKILRYEYTFRPLPGMELVESRELRGVQMDLPENLTGSEEQPLHIGEVRLDLNIFDREPQILAFGISDKKGLKELLDMNGGIRVYRDGVRVYDYGEPGNDWLELGGRRVNVPVKRISNNLVIGAVSLNLNQSQDLIEKTNREGFVEGEASRKFREAILFSLIQIEKERNIDKERIRRAYSRKRQKEPVMEDLLLLRTEIENRGLAKDLSKYLDRIETQFLDVRDRLLTAAGAGLSLAVVIHEVEKGIKELAKAVERDVSISRIRELASHLSELVEGLTFLTRKSGHKKENSSILIKHALFNTEYRLRYHEIKVFKGTDLEDPEFHVKCSRRLIIATLMNLIDNSIWWLDNKGSSDKRIYIGTTYDLSGGPAIVIADNGPGFIDPPEYLIQPFMSRKPDGMGLGLHLASEVMKAHGGRVEFPETGDMTLPDGINGAVVALIFKE